MCVDERIGVGFVDETIGVGFVDETIGIGFVDVKIGVGFVEGRGREIISNAALGVLRRG